MAKGGGGGFVTSGWSVMVGCEENSKVDEYEHNKFCCWRSFGTVSTTSAPGQHSRDCVFCGAAPKICG